MNITKIKDIVNK